MVPAPRSEPVVALALRGRVRTLRIGMWPSVFACFSFVVYVGWTWEGPHRPALLALGVMALLATLGMGRVPIERLVRGSCREPFFLLWSASLVAFITTMSALDGGASSPVATAYYGPLVYAALCYPLASFLAVAALDLAAYVGLAVLVGGASTPAVFIVASSLLAAAWICAWQAHDLGVQRRDLARVSRTDPLTGALNRRGFEERLEADLVEARRHGRSVALVLFDLDHFKQVNDRQGHAVGDELLCWVVETLERHVRAADCLGRLGGDEFALVLDEHPDVARATVDRLLELLAERTRVSAGIASFPVDGSEAEELHRAADLELYAHKQESRSAVPAASRESSWATALAR